MGGHTHAAMTGVTCCGGHSGPPEAQKCSPRSGGAQSWEGREQPGRASWRGGRGQGQPDAQARSGGWGQEAPHAWTCPNGCGDTGQSGGGQRVPWASSHLGEMGERRTKHGGRGGARSEGPRGVLAPTRCGRRMVEEPGCPHSQRPVLRGCSVQHGACYLRPGAFPGPLTPGAGPGEPQGPDLLPGGRCHAGHLWDVLHTESAGPGQQGPQIRRDCRAKALRGPGDKAGGSRPGPWRPGSWRPCALHPHCCSIFPRLGPEFPRPGDPQRLGTILELPLCSGPAAHHLPVGKTYFTSGHFGY